MTRFRDLPQLETPRLTLRVPTARDARAMVRFVVDNREHLGRWEPGRTATYYTDSYWKRELNAALMLQRQGLMLRFVLELRERPEAGIQGHATFTHVVRGPLQGAYLGYALDRNAVGQGLMFEALTAALTHAFEELNLHRVMANYMPDNERSGRLLERLGFEREGLAKDYLLIDGAWRDHVLTSRVNTAWRPDS
ncbi:MAG: GNAT family N-acetyltransferase [bacterium]|nr:GNAT family N-acetyltransferase [bacterium]